MEVKSKLAGTIGVYGRQLVGDRPMYTLYEAIARQMKYRKLSSKELEEVVDKMTEMRNTYQGMFYEKLKVEEVPQDINCHEAIEFLFKNIFVQGPKDQLFIETFLAEVLFEDAVDLEGELFEPEYRLSLKRLEMVDTFLNKWLVTGF